MERDYYNAHAAEYAERWNQKPALELFRKFEARLAGRARVLDAGCGTGRDLALFAEAGHRAVGVDYSEGMLAEAAKLFDGPLVHADLRALPFDDGSFDGIWALASLVHLDREDAVVALRELRRVCADDGVVFVSVKGRPLSTDVKADSEPRRFTVWDLAGLSAALLDAGFSHLVVSRQRSRRTEWINATAWPAAEGHTDSRMSTGRA